MRNNFNCFSFRVSPAKTAAPEPEAKAPSTSTSTPRGGSHVARHIGLPPKKLVQPHASTSQRPPRAELPESSSAPALARGVEKLSLQAPTHADTTPFPLAQLPLHVAEKITERLGAYDSLALARVDTESYQLLRDTSMLKTLRLDAQVAQVKTLHQFRELLTGEGAADPRESIASLTPPHRAELVRDLLARIKGLPEADMAQAFDLGHEAIRQLPEGRRSEALQSLIGQISSLPRELRTAEFARCREAVRQLADDPAAPSALAALTALTQQAWSVPIDMSAILAKH
jgi:hypothetical protein